MTTGAFKPTLSVDFDGVLNPYTQGWMNGEIYDAQPMVGARGALETLSQTYRIAITTARPNLDVVNDALENWGLAEFVDEVSNMKPPAVAYIDDKAIQFQNWDQALQDLDTLVGGHA